MPLEYRTHGCTIREHSVPVPLNRSRCDSPEIRVFVREIIPDGGENRPYLIFFQGGPGSPSPRQGNPHDGWLGEALKHHRVLLLDQRGTGRSHQLDALTLCEFDSDAEKAAYLANFRADSIVADAEDLRAYFESPAWYGLGQSYGGFCLATYLSRAPEGLAGVYITGGLPAVDASLDDIYRHTYSATTRRNREYLRQYPDAQLIRDIATHLEGHEEILPTGERLSARRFRTLGIAFGGSSSFDALHYLLEDPFTTVRGQKRLNTPFLTRMGAHLSFAGNPLYAVMHETIYGGTMAGAATDWAAHRIRAEFPGMEENADPRDTEYYLTGEHIYPWQFEEDPALIPLRGTAEILAARTDWEPLYDLAALDANKVPVAAAIYAEDMYVPYEYSRALADRLGARAWVTNEYHHDGLHSSGGRVLARLFEMAAQ